MSISEIARKLQVAKSTVSLVINGKAQQSRISKELEQRILDYVKEVGFKPNALAKSLATGRSHTIGLIVENIGDSFFGPIALRIEEYLRTKGYHVLYSSTVGKKEVACSILASMVDKKVEGLIISPTLGLEKEIQKVIQLDIPLVLFDRKAKLTSVNYVGTDNFTASRQAVLHLIQQGYTRIGIVTSDSRQSQMVERLQAYQETMKEHTLPAKILRVPFASTADERIHQMAQFLDRHPLDALYFSTNYLCLSGIKAIQSVPSSQKYGILSFDDHEVFELLHPSITCVRQPIEEIAHHIVNNLLAQINRESEAPSEHIIPSQLLIRKSTRPE